MTGSKRSIFSIERDSPIMSDNLMIDHEGLVAQSRCIKGCDQETGELAILLEIVSLQSKDHFGLI